MKINSMPILVILATVIWLAIPVQGQLNCSGGNNSIVCGGLIGSLLSVTSNTAPFTTGASKTIKVAQNSNNTTFNALCLNGIVTDAGCLGLFGGDASNDNIYVDGVDSVILRSGGNVTAFTCDSAQKCTAAQTLVAAVSAVVGGSSVPTGYAFSVDAGTSRLNGRVYAANLASEPSTKSALCVDPVTGEVESNAAAACAVSNLQQKDFIDEISCRDAKRIVKQMKPGWFVDKADRSRQRRAGFAAEWVDQVDPRLVYRDGKDKPHGVDYERYTAVLTRVSLCSTD